MVHIIFIQWEHCHVGGDYSHQDRDVSLTRKNGGGAWISWFVFPLICHLSISVRGGGITTTSLQLWGFLFIYSLPPRVCRYCRPPVCPSHPCTWTSVFPTLWSLPLCSVPQTQFDPCPLVVFRSWVCSPYPLRIPVLPPQPPKPLPLPPESPRFTSPAGAHRVPTGLPPGRHHASVCLTHATPLGYCSLAATHHVDHSLHLHFTSLS